MTYITETNGEKINFIFKRKAEHFSEVGKGLYVSRF